MPEVLCASVGALGEVNRSTVSFLNRFADVGSDNPERSGCCHEKCQAQGVIASFLGCRVFRVVRVRNVALETAAGPAYGAPSRGGAGRAGAGDPDPGKVRLRNRCSDPGLARFS